MNLVSLQIDQPHSLEVPVGGHPFRREPWPLTPARKMTIQPISHIRIYFPERLAWISTPEIIRPAAQMFVEFVNQLGNRLKAHLCARQLTQMLPLSGQSLIRWVHVQLATITTLQVKVESKRITQKIKTFSLFSQVQHTCLFPVDLQPQPTLNLRFNPARDTPVNITG